MPKLNETLTDTGYFNINSISHQKGAYDIEVDSENETVGVFNVHHKAGSREKFDWLHYPSHYSEWTNEADESYNSLNDLLGDLDLAFFLTKSKSGSGGSANYEDTSTSGEEALIPATFTDMPNDGLGALTNISFLPTGITTLMDNLTGYIDVSQLSLGDSILVRPNFIVTPVLNNLTLTIRYVLGTGLNQYTIDRYYPKLDMGGAIPYTYSLLSDLIPIYDNNTRNNPIKIQIRLSNSGVFVNLGCLIQVIRR